MKNLIRGIIIFTSELGVKFMRERFEGDDSKLVHIVTSDTNAMLKCLEILITSSKVCCIRSFEELSFFFTNEFKHRLLKMHSDIDLDKSLIEFNPKKINLSQIFKDVNESL